MINKVSPLNLALLLWLVVGGIVAATLPLLPVDETRYLTVAWEMRDHHSWLLPTLNGAPYSHKPPLLFWLVNLAWTFGGLHIWTARLVFLAVTAGVIVLTARLGKALYGEKSAAPALAVPLLAASPALFLYGGLIMFDMLLALSVLLSLLALWQAAQGGGKRSWLLLGFALGIGLLIKGPVVLLHIAFPVLLIKFWKPAAFSLSYKKWAGCFFAALALGVAMILGWAIPAAITGGPEFAHMIFWGQTAGRMVSSFDHDRPIWFYLPIVIGFFFPFFFWRPLWRAVAATSFGSMTSSMKFLLCWIVPTFIAFCLISGKQPHYLLPLLPGIMLLFSGMLQKMETRPRDFILLFVPYLILFGAMAAAPFVVGHTADPAEISHVVREGIGSFNSLWFIAAGAGGMVALYLLRKTIATQAMAMAICSALLLSTLTIQMYKTVYPNFDLRPLAAAMQPYKDGPVAFVRKYAGEIGFLGRVDNPFDVLERNELRPWLDAHPDGVAIVRYKKPEELDGFKAIYTQTYKNDQHYSIVLP